MLNIERYKEKLKKCKGVALDCQIYKLRKECKEAESGFCLSNPCSACREDNIEWLLSEYKEPILDEVEKRYLRGVIRPFRNMVAFIKKTCNCVGFQWIEIAVKGNKTIVLPGFRNDEMYKGMKLEKEYTLEELGL